MNIEEILQNDGVYIYENGVWRRLEVEGPYIPLENGVYIIYFRNRMCAGCKNFDYIWRRFIDVFKKGFGKPVLIQCTDFFYNCNSQSASDSFIFYLVFSTPQVIVAIIEDGIPIYIERETYFENVESLESFVYGVYERKKVFESQPIEEEESEGIYIDLSNRNWKEVVEKIKKMVFEGKNIREICNENICRIILE